MTAIASILLLFSAGWILSGYLPTRNIKTPGYRVLEKRPGYEVRRYDAYVVAETPMSGGEKSGFRTLFDYITGNNVARAKVEMTAPVIERQQREAKIEMTAPVIKRGESASRTIAFVMPPGMDLAELPRPKNDRITLRVVEPETVAVLSFAGNPTDGKTAKKTAALLAAVRRDGRREKGEPWVALYNPPWTPPFMKKTEVMVEIE